MNKSIDISTEVIKTIRKIMRAVDVQSKKLVRNYGLTGPQILLLKELDYEIGITVGEIAGNINLSQSTVTNILERLEGRGYVSRTRSDTDKRRVFVKITEKGSEILQKNPSVLQEDFVNRFLKLKDWEQTLILSSLQKVAGMMDATEIEEPPVLDTAASAQTAEISS